MSLLTTGRGGVSSFSTIESGRGCFFGINGSLSTGRGRAVVGALIAGVKPSTGVIASWTFLIADSRACATSLQSA